MLALRSWSRRSDVLKNSNKAALPQVPLLDGDAPIDDAQCRVACQEVDTALTRALAAVYAAAAGAAVLQRLHAQMPRQVTW